jgi:hypothetical protein
MQRLEEKMRFTRSSCKAAAPNKQCAKVTVACGLAGMPWYSRPKCVKGFNEGIQYNA